MAVNANVLTPRAADRKLFLIVAAGFPLLVLAGYFRTYYFSAFFDVKPLATRLAHAHAIVMSVWVLYFTAQTFLIRAKNVKLHMTMGWVGVALAITAIVVGMAAAYDAHLVRNSAPSGIDPHSFFVIPCADMTVFAILFGAAIYYRKRPAEHKSLMLLTVVNFLSPVFGRLPLVPPQYLLLWVYGVPDLMALACFGWYTWKHKKFNKVFAAGILLMIVSQPIRVMVAGSQAWLAFTAWLAP